MISLLDIGHILKQHMPELARRELPEWLVRFMALFMSDLKLVLSDLGKQKSIASEKASRILGWKPRSNREAIVATEESLARLGLIKR